jgi:hypothetical protein
VERINVKAAGVIALPAGTDPCQAAMLKANPATAELLLTEIVPLGARDWLIQNAANSSEACAVSAQYCVRPDDGERVARVWKQPTGPTQRQPVDGQKFQPAWFTPAQHDDLVAQNKEFCFQCSSRPEQSAIEPTSSRKDPTSSQRSRDSPRTASRIQFATATGSSSRRL